MISYINVVAIKAHFVHMRGSEDGARYMSPSKSSGTAILRPIMGKCNNRREGIKLIGGSDCFEMKMKGTGAMSS
jgi:hypothetical protein